MMSGAVGEGVTNACYGLASHTPWGMALFDRLQAKSSNRWIMISSPELLAADLEQECPRLIFFPHWSHVIPDRVWQRHECIIFHMTDLPYGRGGSPLQNLISRGHSETMVCALRCVGEIDAGPIYMKRPLALVGSAREILNRAMRVIEHMINELVVSLPEPQPQHGEVVRFTRRTPQMSRIDDLVTLDAMYDHIRMLDAEGYPRAFTDVGGFRLEFDRAVRTADGVEARVVFRQNTGDSGPADTTAEPKI